MQDVLLNRMKMICINIYYIEAKMNGKLLFIYRLKKILILLLLLDMEARDPQKSY